MRAPHRALPAGGRVAWLAAGPREGLDFSGAASANCVHASRLPTGELLALGQRAESLSVTQTFRLTGSCLPRSDNAPGSLCSALSKPCCPAGRGERGKGNGLVLGIRREGGTGTACPRRWLPSGGRTWVSRLNPGARLHPTAHPLT